MTKQLKMMLLVPVFCLFAAGTTAEGYSADDTEATGDETTVEADDNQGQSLALTPEVTLRTHIEQIKGQLSLITGPF